MALTKEQLTESIRNHCGLPRGQSAQLIDSILEIIKLTLECGEDVLISGFGKFCVKEKKDRRGRNPQTGEALTLDARRVVSFKSSPVLRDRINGVG
jgi:integration host factor subunit alpha